VDKRYQGPAFILYMMLLLGALAAGFYLLYQSVSRPLLTVTFDLVLHTKGGGRKAGFYRLYRSISRPLWTAPFDWCWILRVYRNAAHLCCVALS
jgi:hypothetical protein